MLHKAWDAARKRFLTEQQMANEARVEAKLAAWNERVAKQEAASKKLLAEGENQVITSKALWSARYDTLSGENKHNEKMVEVKLQSLVRSVEHSHQVQKDDMQHEQQRQDQKRENIVDRAKQYHEEAEFTWYNLNVGQERASKALTSVFSNSELERILF